MQNSIVRIHKVAISNIKNTESGTLAFATAFDEKFPTVCPDILGIYGQNGTGKTAVIDALTIVQHVLAGRTLPKTTQHILLKNSLESSITVTFFITYNNKCTKVEYKIVLRTTECDENQRQVSHDGEEEPSVQIIEERLRYAPWNDTNFEHIITLIHTKNNNTSTFLPKKRYEELIGTTPKDRIIFAVASGMAQKKAVSRIFYKDCRELFISSFEKSKENLAYILESLAHYARMNFFVIQNKDFGFINSNVFMPMSFFIANEKTSISGQTPMSLQGAYIISPQEYNVQKKIVAQVKLVLSKIIPQIELEFVEHGKELLQNGKEGIRVELVSKRNGITIPLQYESAGIIKILSLLSAFIHVYNNASACLVVDELDSGIFEYLLGEILQLFAESGKGQIIFTSHNLRPLEVLNKSQVIFSTTNPAQRYIKLKNIKPNNNMRDKYLRHILLGGQEEELYEKTNKTSIARALRKAVKGL